MNILSSPEPEATSAEITKKSVDLMFLECCVLFSYHEKSCKTKYLPENKFHNEKGHPTKFETLPARAETLAILLAPKYEQHSPGCRNIFYEALDDHAKH